LAVSVSIDDATFKIEQDQIEDLNPVKTYIVQVKRVSVAEIEVEATDASSAEDQVDEMLSNGELPEEDFETYNEIIESVEEI
jgi:hypothetical protein